MALTDEQRQEIKLTVAKELSTMIPEILRSLQKTGFTSLQLAGNVINVIEKKLAKQAKLIEADIIEKDDPQRAAALRAMDPEF